MKPLESLIQEFDHETQTTRKHLERLPEDKFDWRPHQKSFTAINLASHIVECIGWTESIFSRDELDIDFSTYRPFQAASKNELLDSFERNVSVGKEVLQKTDEAALDRLWQLKVNGKQWIEKPKADVFRDFVLSHVIHHRGQYSVYLRLLEIPVPGSYGPSADDPPPEGF